MNYDKRFYQIWGKNVGIAVLVAAAFIGTMYVLTQLPVIYAAIIIGAYIIGYTGWVTFSMAKFKRETELRHNQRVMDTLKQENF